MMIRKKFLLTQNKIMIILGIDPGYDRMGLAVLEKNNGKETLIYSECVKTNRKDSHEKRLLQIGKGIENAALKHKPDVMAIEKLFFTTNQKTAIKVSEARGTALYVAAKYGLRVVELTPLEIKMALTGYGKAEKFQVQKMVAAILKIDISQNIDDEIDAIAAAIACPIRSLN
ncbi:MAG: crossover junction endodeoxyribonuclease RuvC [bacterium]|nr:crossover junction endodeoxyribonuclease RuvC [bacterium]